MNQGPEAVYHMSGLLALQACLSSTRHRLPAQLASKLTLLTRHAIAGSAPAHAPAGSLKQHAALSSAAQMPLAGAQRFETSAPSPSEHTMAGSSASSSSSATHPAPSHGSSGNEDFTLDLQAQVSLASGSPLEWK